MKNSILFIAVLFLLSSCTKSENIELVLRVENGNNFDYDAVQVVSPSTDHQYGSVEANTSSDYFFFDELYSYAYINVRVNDKEYILQPIDYVGESLLNSGKYTFYLEVDTTSDTYGSIYLTLVKD